MPGSQPDQRLLKLAEKMLSGKITPEERLEFEAWYSSFDDTEHEQDSRESIEALQARLHQQIFERAGIVTVQPVKIVKWPRIAAVAAAAIVLLGLSIFLFKENKPTRQIAKVQQDLKPGMNGAILTLSNGQKVILEKTKVGQIATGVKKSNDSLLVYNNTQTIGYNTLETPKGRQYAVVLPDGSKVWLNAASSLKYPTKFTGNQRLVELTGEGYFEVVHNSKMPFRVKTKNQLTEDIATSFNVNSYADEPATVTTLIEGGIKVNNKLIKPGYSAISALSTTTEIKQADIEEITAWKNGFFSFHKADLPTVMRQISRWYDVKVVYEGDIPKGSFTGSIYRNVNASQALKILSYANINFKIENDKIIITK